MLNFGGVSIHPSIGVSIRDPFFGVRTKVQDPTPWAQHLQRGGPWMKQGNPIEKKGKLFFHFDEPGVTRKQSEKCGRCWEHVYLHVIYLQVPNFTGCIIWLQVLLHIYLQLPSKEIPTSEFWLAKILSDRGVCSFYVLGDFLIYSSVVFFRYI